MLPQLDASPETEHAPSGLSPSAAGHHPARLYALDWLRVIAVLGVFLFHAVHPFDLTAWHIKNAEQSALVTFVIAFMFPWGMPFFFLLAGAGSYLALRRRSAAQFARERFNRLLLPFVAGAASVMPLMLYFEWRHKTQTGLLTGRFLDFLLDRNVGFTPVWFGALGYHLWFLGFLFSFSILSLPIFLWLKREAGQRLLAGLARLCRRPGALLLAFVPLAVVRLALHPLFPQEHSWADFFVQLSFFLLGYLLLSDPAFLQAVRRDWRLNLGVGIVAAASALAIVAATGSLDLEAPPRTPLDVLFWVLIALDSWSWTLFFLFVGLRFLNHSNRLLAYGQAAILPFFVFHQPVIIILAYYAVQWRANLWVKLLFVVLGSLVVTLGLYEFLIRRVALLRRMFGMKRAPMSLQLRDGRAAPTSHDRPTAI
jgi:peptidoglycan/LPS O-acetylase OafA/YrhL